MNSKVISAFVYDGDGNRVKSTIGTITTAFVGNHTEWEVASSSLTRYYYAGSTRVAMRKNNTVYYLLGDHLGSTSITTDQNGQNPAQQLYAPWGEVRYSSGSLQTKYTYTGQYSNVSDFGLMYYNARFYDPLLSRFSSADSIIPQPGSPQAWDRYAYVQNSPVNFTDPSGHMVACEQDDICDHGYPTHLRNPRLLAKENDASSDISSGLINVQEFIPPFDTGLGGNYKADQGVQTSDNKISLIALVLIGIPLSVATVIVDIGLVAGEIALISSSIVVPELAPVIVPLGLVLAGTGLVITDLDLSYWVFTYRVASAPEGEPVNFEILLPWNKDE